MIKSGVGYTRYLGLTDQQFRKLPVGIGKLLPAETYGLKITAFGLMNDFHGQSCNQFTKEIAFDPEQFPVFICIKNFQKTSQRKLRMCIHGEGEVLVDFSEGCCIRWRSNDITGFPAGNMKHFFEGVNAETPLRDFRMVAGTQEFVTVIV